MKFCICGTIMTKQISTDFRILYSCTCGERIDGGPEDTLMYEEHIEKKDIQSQYEMLIENAAHDAARSLVAQPCPKCNIDRITQIFIQPDMQTLYVCDCGYRSSYLDKKQ